MPRHRKNEPGLFDTQFELPLFAEPETAPGALAEAEPPLILSAEPLVRRTFLGWEKPLVRSAVEHLATDWDGEGVFDLSDRMVIVPTRHAGRQLREALAIAAAEKDAAVVPPLTVTPEFFTSPARLSADASTAAGRAETLLIWTGEMLRLSLDSYRNVFPVDPVERNFTWSLKTTSDLLQVRETLGEAGLSFGEAARILGGSEMEPERWRELARLESRCVRATEKLGLADRQSARRRAAGEGELPPGIARIILLATLDPSPLAIRALERFSRRVPVEIVIHAPANSHAGLFDAWGRPVEERWIEQNIDIPAPNATIHQGATPAEQAERAVELLDLHADAGASAAIGVPDPEIVAPLEKALAAREFGAFNPAGKRLGTHGVFYLLRVFSLLVGNRSFKAVCEFIRCPDALEAIRRHIEDQTGERPAMTALLCDLDKLAVETLPDTLDDAIDLAGWHFDPERRRSSVPDALAWIDGWLKRFRSEKFGEVVTEFLGEIFAARRFRSDDPQDAVFAGIADQINGALDALDGPAASAFPGKLNAADRLELLLHLLEDQVYYPEREPRDVDLQGWLELLWENAPHLVITGMNDGKVPEAILGHQYLPDSARQALGIRHNDSRFARDACLLTCALESRKRNGGRVDFVFGRIGAGEEPLRPSRLLLKCPEEELPARTLQFFRKPAADAEPMPWKLAWQLEPAPLDEDARIFQRLRVTQFRSYLTCPFRFYLSQGLEMEEIDTARTEMDPMQFGTLVHEVMERFFKRDEAASSTDTGEICEEFHAILDKILHRTYGPRLTVPVTIQRESARQRLAWWAELEAEERAKGWEIVAAETQISPPDDAWEFGGTVISGTVDRVERHPEHGIRLIDFKTFSPYNSKNRKRRTVEEYHLAKIKRTECEEDFPGWALTRTDANDVARWIDLQLPLYRLGMERHYPGETITAAYATLGKTKADIGLDEWPELEGALLDSARECAEGVIAAVRDRIFWPPAERLPFSDAFGSLFFGDAKAAVDPTLLTQRPNPADS